MDRNPRSQREQPPIPDDDPAEQGKAGEQDQQQRETPVSNKGPEDEDGDELVGSGR